VEEEVEIKIEDMEPRVFLQNAHLKYGKDPKELEKRKNKLLRSIKSEDHIAIT
jgi:hypothetical protein